MKVYEKLAHENGMLQVDVDYKQFQKDSLLIGYEALTLELKSIR